MKKFNSRIYLYVAIVGLLLIAGLVVFHLMTSVSKSDNTVYLFIDEDDTQDSVLVKLQPLTAPAGMASLSALLRHSDYSQHVRSGRYAIEPGDNPITVFRRLKNGQQSSFNLTIPEVRTMDRLAAVLGQKLMLDSATIADALYSQETCQHYGYDTTTIAAMFVPNTYDVYWNMSTDKLLERMQKEHDRFWEGEREARQRRCSSPRWRFVRWPASSTRRRQTTPRNR